MSTKKAGGSKAHQGTPRKGRRLGVKVSGGQSIKTGQIILTQAGSRYHAGKFVKRGRDFSLLALKDGSVQFRTLKGKSLVEII